MVELTLESVSDTGMPKDCFVSVRLGEVQKLSRLSANQVPATHVFKFPQASDRRIGKVEIFRRIGACSIDVDPLREGMRDVSVPCGEAGFGNLGLRLAVGAPGGEDAGMTKVKPEASKGAAKKKAAKDYLAKHCLEVQLSDAVQAVLREQPENPVEFLAAKLLRQVGGGAKLPPIGGTSGGDSAPMPESRRPPPSPPSELAAGGARKPQPQRLEPLAGNAAPPTIFGRAPLPPSGSPPEAPGGTSALHVGAKQFAKMPPSAFQRIYAKFPSYTQRTIVNQFAKMPPSAFQRIHAKFPAYTERTAVNQFAKMPPAAFQRIYAKLPAFTERTAVNQFAKMPPSAFQRIYAMFPSYAQRTSKKQVPAGASGISVKQCSAGAKQFAKMPVAAWEQLHAKFLALRSRQSAGLAPSAQPQRALPPTRLPAAGAGAPSGWRHAPSVGSWLAAPAILRPQVHTAAPRSNRFLPSVGTWLAPPPEPEAADEPRKHLMAAHTLLGPLVYSVRGMHPNGMRMF